MRIIKLKGDLFMRFIDYDVLIEKIEHPPYTLYNAEMRADWLDECITKANIVEAELLKYGHWIIEKGSGEYATCSECGNRSWTQWDGVEPIPLLTPSCPYCRAIMNKGDC
jgi:hypothetical protein